MEIQNHATGMPRTITMKASRLAASENLGMSGMPMTCKSIKKNANFHYEANTIEVTKATPVSALFYVFLLIFRYFIVSFPHHQNDKRYAAKYNRKKARNQLVGELHQLQ